MFDDITTRRAIPSSGQLADKIKRVVVILTGSRSGSSLFKQVITQHPAIACLSGEMEPFLFLTRNVFPYVADSDALLRVTQRDELLASIFDDLSLPSTTMPEAATLKQRWQQRLLLQFPALFAGEERYQAMLAALDTALATIYSTGVSDEQVVTQTILQEVYKAEPWRMNFYDGFGDRNIARPFAEDSKIEEPPFVTPPVYRRAFTEADAKDKILLFKTPQDCYRIGLYEQLFPQAEITYIHLTRGFSQTVNGLIDGWLSPIGFFAHDMRQAGHQLAIKGYSDTVPFGQWWKFDLPPNWKVFSSASLLEVCLNQWLSAHQTIVAHQVASQHIQFEKFLTDPRVVAHQFYRSLGLAEIDLPDTLPIVMATTKPTSFRWRARADQLLPLAQRTAVQATMRILGYSLDPQTWR